MISGSIGRRYAKALLEIAKKENEVDDYLKQLQQLSTILKESKDLSILLFDPTFETSDRKKVLDSIAKKLKFSSILQNFLKLLIDRGRMIFFDDILRSYQEQADEVLGRVHVKVTVPDQLPVGTDQLLKDKLEKTTKKNVILEIFSNPQLLGGMTLKIKNQVFDSSVKTALV